MSDLILKLAAWVAQAAPPWMKRGFYRLGPLTVLIRRTLNRAAPNAPTRVTVAGGVLAGAEMILNQQAEKDYWLGTYD